MGTHFILNTTKLLLVLMLSVSLSYATNCYHDYPLYFGDSNGNTQFTAMDMDKLSNIIVGGNSYSTLFSQQPTQVIYSVFQMTQILVYYGAASVVTWASQISTTSTYTSVLGVKFENSASNSATAMVLLSRNGDSSPMSFMIVYTATGLIKNYMAFQDSTSTIGIGYDVKPNGFLWTSSGYLFVASKSTIDNNLNLMAIKPSNTATLSSKWVVYPSNADYAGTSNPGPIVIGRTSNDVYLVSSLEYQNQNSSVYLQQLSISLHNNTLNGETVFQFALSNQTDSTYAEGYNSFKVVFTNTTEMDYISGCTKYSVDSSQYFFQLVVDYTYKTIVSDIVISMNSYTGSSTIDCLDVQSGSTSLNVLSYDSSNDQYYLTGLSGLGVVTTSITYTLKQFQLDQVQSSTLLPLGKIINSYNDIYFAGSSTSSLQNSPVYSGFITTYDYYQRCNSYQTITNTSGTIDNLNTLYYFETIDAIYTTYSTTYSFTQITNVLSSIGSSLLQTDLSTSYDTAKFQMQKSCSNPNRSPVTFSTVAQVDKTHIIEVNGNFTLTFSSFFTGETSCKDQYRVYTVSLTPASHPFTINTGAKTVTCIWSSLVIGTYQLSVTAKISDGQTQTNSVTIFIQGCQKNYTVTKTSISNYEYYITGDTIVDYLPSFTISPSYCNFSLTYSLQQTNGDDLTNTPITFDSSTRKLTIHTDNSSLNGIYYLEYTMTDSYGNVNTQYFQVYSKCYLSLSNKETVTSFQYKIGQRTTFIFSDLAYSSNCDLDIQYKTYNAKTFISIPTYIKLTPSSSGFKYSILTFDSRQAGNYTYRLKATLQDNNRTYNEEFSFSVEIIAAGENHYAPKFTSDLDDQVLVVGSSSTYTLPKTTDEDDDQVSIDVSLGSSSSFTTYSSGKFTFEPKSADYSTSAYIITVTLTDSGIPSLQKTYKISIQVFNAETDEDSSTEATNNSSLTFQKQLEDYNKFTNMFSPRIKSISMRGSVVVYLNQDFTFKNNSFKNLKINIQYIPGDLDQPHASLSQWVITSYQDKVVNIELIFTNPLLVSNSEVKDRLKIEFSFTFVNTDSRILASIKKQTYTIQKEIPPQISPSDIQTIEQFGDYASSAVSATVATNLVFSVFLQDFTNFIKFSQNILSIIWGALNNLQLIVHLPLFKINFPSNVNYFLLMLLDIATLNIMPSTSVSLNLLTITSDDPGYDLDDRYQLLGYNNCFMVSNISYMLKFFAILIGIVISYFVLGCIIEQTQPVKEVIRVQDSSKEFINPQRKPTCFHRSLIVIQKIMKEKLFYSAFLRLLLENYLVLSIITFVILFNFLHFSHWMEILNSAITIGSVVLLIGTILGITIFLMKNKNRLFEEKIKLKYDSLYDNVVENKSYTSYFVILFLLRRLIFGLTIQYFSLFSQITINMVASLAMIGYYVKIKPFNGFLLNATEIFNESTYYLCLNFCYLFTNLVPDPDEQYQLGWYLIGLITFNIMVNVVVLIVTLTTSAVKIIRLLINKVKSRKTQTVKLRSISKNNSLMLLNKEDSKHSMFNQSTIQVRPFELNSSTKFDHTQTFDVSILCEDSYSRQDEEINQDDDMKNNNRQNEMEHTRTRAIPIKKESYKLIKS